DGAEDLSATVVVGDLLGVLLLRIQEARQVAVVDLLALRVGLVAGLLHELLVGHAEALGRTDHTGTGGDQELQVLPEGRHRVLHVLGVEALLLTARHPDRLRTYSVGEADVPHELAGLARTLTLHRAGGADTPASAPDPAAMGVAGRRLDNLDLLVPLHDHLG